MGINSNMILPATNDYKLFFRFIETYAPAGFKGINPDDLLMVEMENMCRKNNQFFLIADLVQMAILFTSKRSMEMLGIEPEELNPYNFFEATRPDDIIRHGRGRSVLFKRLEYLFSVGQGGVLLSTNLHMRNSVGGYSNLLLQCYLFYSKIPYTSIFLLEIHTDIDWYKKRKNGFQYYIGEDLSLFKFPDEELLKLGIPYSAREFEIISFIVSGMTSIQIAEKTGLSIHTVNTHRKNILMKSGSKSVPEVIRDLLNQGVI